MLGEQQLLPGSMPILVVFFVGDRTFLRLSSVIHPFCCRLVMELLPIDKHPLMLLVRAVTVQVLH